MDRQGGNEIGLKLATIWFVFIGAIFGANYSPLYLREEFNVETECVAQMHKNNDISVHVEIYIHCEVLTTAKELSLLQQDAIARKEALKDFETEEKLRPERIYLTYAEIDLLNRLVYAEARGEGHRGMILVTNVVLNRIEHPSFPDCVTSVIYESNNGRYQFCPVRSGSIHVAIPSENVINVVEMALSGYDYSHGALFFNRAGQNSWANRNRTFLFAYGNHDFYY